MTTSIEIYNGWLGDGLFASVKSPDLAVSKMQAFESSGLGRLNSVKLNKIDTYVRTYDSSSSYRLSATIEAKGKIDLGIASAEAKVTAQKQLTKTSNSSVLKALVTLEDSTWMLDPEQLVLSPSARFALRPNAGAVSDLRQSSKSVDDNFRALYGDYYCCGITLGGELEANMVLESSVEESLKRVELIVKVKVLFIKKTIKKTKVSVDRKYDMTFTTAYLDSLSSAHRTAYESKNPPSTDRGLEAAVEEMRSRVEGFSDKIGREIERAMSGADADKLGKLKSGNFDRNLVMRFHFNPYTTLPDYLKVRQSSYEAALLEEQALKFQVKELALMRTVMENLRLELKEMDESEKDDRLSTMTAMLEDVSFPLRSELKRSYESYHEFWALDLSKTFREIGYI
uniref:Uncharacterized protein n=1 Tax=Rhodosorus marinus TaxID=101924 RepID=A0A7S3E7A6_9RHOD|mmetsp:Transcript_14733/g.59886  ORF Transcript_14733/g.59886 Transcript_14733/m.59886 type:complete len:398 (+) Transcript_14733:183-1376(+)|eukprot:CAMPEP_0113958320 /NCGR_PEP_ID=MMETSP0011_2-20120614/3325_1 /TAXON_ID=101924 /ORGANISM="Rhodosorus marinus" /LENGTH=397 /DNA_ID=CAMNT_0000969111 /DNA_START=78 /DNA_END=1271 /DNA_ORIENTATION=+ /assembly_acc=CAM_ASM_000156